MTKPKLTDWHIDGAKPHYPGVYNVSCEKEGQTGHWYAKWDGKTWYRAKPTIKGACDPYYTTLSPDYWHEVGSWRGLAQKP